MRLKVTLTFPPQLFTLEPSTFDPACSAMYKLVRLGCNNQSHVFWPAPAGPTLTMTSPPSLSIPEQAADLP